jgi:SWIM zinc finger
VWREVGGVADHRPGAVCLAAPSRLRILEPIARFATGLSAYGDAEATEPSAVTWVLSLPGGRVSATLSPERTRGFSGEGGLLFHLVSGQAASDATTLRDATAGAQRFSLADAASEVLSPERAAAALTWLGVHGHLGFDTVDQAYFHRRLPYPDDVLVADPPRLRDARALADAGAVELAGDGCAAVKSEDREYSSSLGEQGFDCSCPWVAKHGTSRGPCKHVLAVAIIRARSASVTPSARDLSRD